jgi:DNA modification methylase
LLGGDRADLIFTDPPYGVGYQGYTKEKLTIEGDRMSDSEFREYLSASFVNYRKAIKSGASLYVCHASSVQRAFEDAINAAGFEVRC